MDKLQLLISKCKCGIFIEINTYTNDYQSIGKKLDEYDTLGLTDDLDPIIRNRMIETGTVVDIQFYPDTPVGFYKILHHNIDLALDEALNILKSGYD